MKKGSVVLLMLVITTASLAQIPTANLLGYYPFCGNASDLSGNGNNGTVMGATLFTDRFGNPNSAYSFNGWSDYISLPPTSYIGLNIYSYSLWMRPTANANNGYIAYNAGSQNQPYCQGVNYNPPGVFAGSYNVGNNPVQSYINSNPIGINNWMHVVVTRSMNRLTMYVNGVLVSQQFSAYTGNQAADYGSGPYAVNIGTRSTLQNYFMGQIDDVRIYSSELTQNDVTALYNEAPFAISVNSGTVCPGGSFVLTPSGAVSYTYSAVFPMVYPLASTIYTVFGTNGAGCVSSATASVTVSSPTVSVNSGTICPGSSFLLSPSGAVSSYTYSSGSPLVSPLSNTTYTVFGADANGCIASAVSSVTVNSFTISVNSGTICRGASFTLLPGGAVSYTFPGGSAVVSPTVDSNYLITGTSALGCTATATANVSVSKCTGIEQLTTEQLQFVIYPNPSVGEFVISFSTNEASSGEIIFTDLQGRVMKICNKGVLDNTLSIPNDLAPGCYTASFMKNGKITAQKKLVISGQ